MPSTGLYYFADLLAGTSMPSIGNLGFDSTTAARSVLPGGTYREVNVGPGLTSLPATLTPSDSGVTRCIVAR